MPFRPMYSDASYYNLEEKNGFIPDKTRLFLEKYVKENQVFSDLIMHLVQHDNVFAEDLEIYIANHSIALVDIFFIRKGIKTHYDFRSNNINLESNINDIITNFILTTARHKGACGAGLGNALIADAEVMASSENVPETLERICKYYRLDLLNKSFLTLAFNSMLETCFDGTYGVHTDNAKDITYKWTIQTLSQNTALDSVVSNINEAIVDRLYFVYLIYSHIPQIHMAHKMVDYIVKNNFNLKDSSQRYYYYHTLTKHMISRSSYNKLNLTEGMLDKAAHDILEALHSGNFKGFIVSLLLHDGILKPHNTYANIFISKKQYAIPGVFKWPSLKDNIIFIGKVIANILYLCFIPPLHALIYCGKKLYAFVLNTLSCVGSLFFSRNVSAAKQSGIPSDAFRHTEVKSKTSNKQDVGSKNIDHHHSIMAKKNA